MCFSPAADFVAAAVIAPVAVATLRQVRARDERLLGALPALFAAHQLVEGFVWLGLRGDVSADVQRLATWLYLLFAQVALPVLMPLAVLLLERERRRRRGAWIVLGLGVVVAARLLVNLATHPVTATAANHVVLYAADTGFGTTTAIAYVAVTCGPALLSSRRLLPVLGLVNLVGLLVAAAIRIEAVTSVWCLYAELASVLIYLHLSVGGERRGAGLA